MLLVYFWAMQTPQKDVKHELEITKDCTTVDWFNFIRDVYEEKLINPAEMIGGIDFVNGQIEPKIVQIYESKFFHRKYHCGQWWH